jgi:hypothetical protein
LQCLPPRPSLPEEIVRVALRRSGRLASPVRVREGRSGEPP